jgi:hypothetical protein
MVGKLRELIAFSYFMTTSAVSIGGWLGKPDILVQKITEL